MLITLFLKTFGNSKKGITFELKFKIKKEMKKKLMNGKTLIFEGWNGNDDFSRTAECSFRNEPLSQWANGFKIDFNGKLFSFKTFIAFEKKLNQLIKDWNLEPKN